jgi:Rrf2 family protein
LEGQFVRISAKAEYACVALIELAVRHNQGQPVSIKAIADVYGISAGFLIQIMIQLKGAGLVASSRGAAGGYQLARPPDTVALAEVISVIDGPPSGGSALTTLPPQPVVQALLGVWSRIQTAEQALLRHLTLAEMVRMAREGDAPMYHI